MRVEILSPVIAGEDLKIKVTLVNIFSQEPVGTMVIAESGLFDLINNKFIDKYCDAFNSESINVPVDYGEEVTHELSCKIPSGVMTREANVMIKAGYTTKIGSLDGSDYTVIDQRIYTFNIEEQKGISSTIMILVGVLLGKIFR